MADRLACSLPTKANRAQSPLGHRIFTSRNSARRCRWSVDFLGNLPFPPPLNFGAAPYSLQLSSSALKTSMLRAAQISSLTPLISFYFGSCLHSPVPVYEDVPETRCRVTSHGRGPNILYKLFHSRRDANEWTPDSRFGPGGTVQSKVARRMLGWVHGKGHGRFLLIPSPNHSVSNDLAVDEALSPLTYLHLPVTSLSALFSKTERDGDLEWAETAKGHPSTSPRQALKERTRVELEPATVNIAPWSRIRRHLTGPGFAGTRLCSAGKHHRKQHLQCSQKFSHVYGHEERKHMAVFTINHRVGNYTEMKEPLTPRTTAALAGKMVSLNSNTLDSISQVAGTIIQLQLKKMCLVTVVKDSTKRVRLKIAMGETHQHDVLARVDANYFMGTRELSRFVRISKTRVLRILSQQKLHPCHVVLHQALQEGDIHQRVQFCRFVLMSERDDSNFLENILFNHNATFANNGRHQRQWKVGDYVIGPYFIQGTMTCCTYTHFLRETLPALLEDKRSARHTSLFVRRLGHSGAVRWPARSPDLTPLEFFLLVTLKSRIFSTVPTTLEDMEERIVAVYRGITSVTLQATRRWLHQRLKMCVAFNVTSRINEPCFRMWENRVRRCRWSVGFLGDLPFPPPIHSGAAPLKSFPPSSSPKTSIYGENDINIRFACLIPLKSHSTQIHPRPCERGASSRARDHVEQAPLTSSSIQLTEVAYTTRSAARVCKKGLPKGQGEGRDGVSPSSPPTNNTTHLSTISNKPTRSPALGIAIALRRQDT
ncbi:hypothetical protein PR048_032912 [Dryococelus australis]|uniref:Uncharacterized protein n=1 Tax=Dryococelus australis TaxID=614101 RepID=A0ABQ9G3J8_9NEOP|nr:hypothetical protein PR048_032912 [Dryococelus australis]